MGYRDEDPLFARERHHSFRIPITILLLVLILTVSLILINAFINRQVQSQTVSVTIPSLPSALQGYRILHISDLHGASFGERQEGIAATLKNLKYNLVVLSGDMTAPDGSFDGLLELLALLKEDTPVVMIAGDEDPKPIQSTARVSNQVKAEYITAAEKRGVIYLDKPYPLTVGSVTLWLCPESLYSTDIAQTRHSMEYNLSLIDKSPETEDSAAARRAIRYWIDCLDQTEEALAAMKSTDIKLCLTHIPYTAENIAELQYRAGAGLKNNATPVSLVLAGHYNGGQCLLPGLGPVYLPAGLGLFAEDRWFPGQTRVSGLSTIRGVTQYISPGLGSARVYAPLTWRFFNSPTISVLTLTSKLV